MLGWKGIWGSGSVLIEYLIPIPVAGGVLHVPSFVLAALVVMSARNLPERVQQLLPVLAFAVCLFALCLQLDFGRINAWLFTDFQPATSVIKFGKNPLYLFMASDVFWVGVYALGLRQLPSLKSWLILIFVPIFSVGVKAITYATSGPKFETGLQTV